MNGPGHHTGYRHTQPGTYGRWLGGLAVAALATSILVGGIHPIPVLVVAFLCTWSVLTHALTVTVNADAVTVRFGPGVIEKVFATSEIRETRRVRNPWYYGWGVRKYPGGWLYNVAGLDAVEIVLENGRRYRIGTDEPAELHDAIQAARVAPDPVPPDT